MNPVQPDPERIRLLADFLRKECHLTAFDFCTASAGFIYPEPHRPGVLETFFFACAHQFGFWTLRGPFWHRPMIARCDGRELKGSDFLFRACTRAWQARPDALAPAVLAGQSDLQLAALFADDTGRNPLPMWREHLELIRGYCRWFSANRRAPADVLAEAQSAARPLQTLLALLERIPGYAGDPLRKKAMLLAIVLENRPEHFLRVTDPGSAVPIIDYHLQRSMLRMGLIRVMDPGLCTVLEARRLLPAAAEDQIRRAAYEAVRQLIALSGHSAAAVDAFFFQNRVRCPEMTEPDCPACPVHAVCARHARLFQPVFRTTAY